MQTDDEQAVEPADEVVDLAGSAVIFRWLSLREGRADPDVVGLDGGLRALLEQPDLRGGVLIAVGPGARLVGAAGLGLTSGGANAAVAVTDRWQRRGLGRELAQRIVASARAAGCSRLTCRCDRDPEDVDRAAALFGEPCIGSARVGFHHVVVMRLDHSR